MENKLVMDIESCIPAGALFLIKTLEDAGHTAYVVGGCVRDVILGRKPKDWDICTSALPEQIIQIFKKEKMLLTGIQYGTVTVFPSACSSGDGYEITTFRSDGEYHDGRHPDSVQFADAAADFARRDFTINAIGFSPSCGIFDPYDGIKDLQDGVLRCVGNPHIRFAEDRLCVLRMLRFAAVYNLHVEENTSRAALEESFNLKKVSKERITEDLMKMFADSEYPGSVLYKNAVILGNISPYFYRCIGFNQYSPWHEHDLLKHICLAVDYVERGNLTEEDFALVRFAALLHDIGKPTSMQWKTEPLCYGQASYHGHGKESFRISSIMMKECFCFSNEQKKVILDLVLLHDNVPKPKKAICKYGLRTARMFPVLRRSDIKAHGNVEEYQMNVYQSDLQSMDAYEDEIDRIVESREAVAVKDLAVSGYDFIYAGMSPGPVFSFILEELLDMVMEDEIKNEKEELLAKAEDMYRQFCQKILDMEKEGKIKNKSVALHNKAQIENIITALQWKGR